MTAFVERLRQVSSEEFVLLYFGVPATIALLLWVGWFIFGDKDKN